MATDPDRGTRLDRPPGLAPRGSSAAFGIFMLYWIMVPGLTCMALIPFGRSVFDFLYPALACTALSSVVVMPVGIGFASRRRWGVVAFYRGTQVAIVLLAAALVIVAIAIGTSLGNPPPVIELTWAVGAILLGFVLLLPFPLRALRLRYWQPWTTPDQWETGDERISPRVVRALGGRR